MIAARSDEPIPVAKQFSAPYVTAWLSAPTTSDAGPPCEVSHDAVQFDRLRARRRNVMVEREDQSGGIADMLSTHRLEIVERHRGRAVGAERAIDLADHEIPRARIPPGFSSEDLLGDRAPGHFYRTPLKMERRYA
jgi:hypothetical protein